MKTQTLREAIYALLNDTKKEFSTKELYERFENHTKAGIRGTLNRLHKNGVIERVSLGVYKVRD